MILLRHVRNPLRPREATTTALAWRPHVSIRSLAPIAVESCIVYRNGGLVRRDAFDDPVGPHDSLVYIEAAGVEGLTLKAVAIFFAKVGAAVAISYVVAKALGSSPPPLSEEDLNSNTYRFGGIRSNPNAENAPVPVVYGEHAVGGLEIVKYTSAAGFDDEYNVLLLLSEGPVERVGNYESDQDNLRAIDGNLPEGLRINGQPAGNFDDVTCSIRMGSDEQEAVPGFEASISQFAVEQTLTESNSPGPGNVELPEGTYTAGVPADDAELDKWDTAVTYDMLSEADAARLVLGAPSGLYTSSSSSASLLTNTVSYQVRYTELSGGVPTGDTVVLAPQFLSAATTSPIASEYEFPFYDPSSYTPPTPGNYVRVSGTSPTTGTLGPSAQLSSIFDSLPESLQEWTYVVVTRNAGARTSLGTLSDASGYNRHLFWALDSGNNGVRVELLHKRAEVASQTISYAFARVYSVAGGISTQRIETPLKLIPNTDDWIQFSVAYDFDAVSQQGRARVYVNGSLLATGLGTAVSLPTTADLEVDLITQSSFTGGNATLDLDDLRFYQRTLSPSEIASLYNAGAFQFSPGTENGIKVSLDVQALPATNKAPAGGTLAGTSLSVLSGGVVPQNASGLANKRATYRIEVQRLNAEDVDDLSQDRIDLESALFVQFESFRYPGCALLGLKIRATDQLNGGPPSVTIPVRGRRCPVWDGLSSDLPTYQDRWTRNPAWIAVDALLDTEYGLGDVHDPTKDIDVVAFQELADACDELLPNGLPSIVLENYTSFAFTRVASTTGGPTTYTLVFSTTGTPVVSVPLAVDDYFQLSGLVTPIVGQEYNSLANEGYQVVSVDVDVFGTVTIEAQAPASFNVPSSDTSGGFGPGDEPVLTPAEPRFQYDGVFDRPRSDGWDAVLGILQTARAFPVRYGNRVSVVRNAETDVDSIVTMGNIVPGSFTITYSGLKDRPNAVAIEILDRNRQYERRLIEREDPSLTDPANEDNFRRRRIRMEGITRESQALREAVYQLNTARLRDRLVEFELDIDGMLLYPGARVLLAHDVPQWGISGRLRSGGSTTTLSLDRDVVIDGVSTYEIWVQDAGTGEIDSAEIANLGGTYTAGTQLTLQTALSFQPEADDKYTFGVVGEVYRDFVVTDTDLDPQTLRRKITGLNYDVAVFDDSIPEILEQLSASASDAPADADLIPSGPLDLVAVEGVDVSKDGSASLFIQASWTNDPETFQALSGTEIWLERISSGARVKVGEAPGQATSFRIASAEILPGEAYRVFARPRSRSGFARPVRSSAAADVAVEGFGPEPGAISGAGLEFAADLATYDWENPEDNIATGVELRHGGWILGQRLFVAPEGSVGAGPTHGWVAALDSSNAHLDVLAYVRNFSATGVVGEASTFALSALPEALTIEQSREFSFFNWSLVGQLALTGATIEADNTLTANLARLRIDMTVDRSSPAFAARWYLIQPFWEAEQVYDLTWEDAEFEWGSATGRRWLWEGPSIESGDERNATVHVSIATSVDGTVPVVADLEPYSFGPRFFRSALIRIEFVVNAQELIIRRAGYSILEAAADTRRAASFPASPLEGDQFYRTDLEAWFYYDASRSKWLSVESYAFTFFTINALGAAQYFRLDDDNLVGGASVGYSSPWDLVVVGMSGLDVISTTANRQVRANGSNVTGGSVSVTASSGTYEDMTLNSATISQGDVIALINLTGMSAASHHTVYCRRVAT